MCKYTKRGCLRLGKIWQIALKHMIKISVMTENLTHLMEILE